MAIHVLTPNIYNRISAGEVVEKPASVVKELVENSLDAGAKKIRVEIEEGGTKRIVVSDDGCGISKEDLPLAFLPHATSKISGIDDLSAISTLGFRGEALASIAAVSIVSLSTKTKEAETGYKIEAKGGEISKISEIARLDGTTICVDNLFFNTPVRAKFLRKPKAEESEITHLFEKFMMSHPEVGFVYVVDGKEIYNHSSGTLDEVVYLIYGKEVHSNLLSLDHEEDQIRVTGFVVGPKISRPNRTYQSLFVNDRYVENYMISACVSGAYAGVLMKNRYPIYIIKLEVPLDRVDVNVHPNKREVKFDNPNRIFGIIRRAVEKALVGADLISEFSVEPEISPKDLEPFHVANEQEPQLTGFYAPESKLQKREGKSFEYKLDDPSLSERLSTPKDYQKAGIEIINMPDFSSVKSDKKPIKNRPGGNIFFDHSGSGLLYEVDVTVQKKKEELQKQEEKQKENVVQEQFLRASANDIKLLGVAFKTYIFTEFEDAIYVIDQHAMHERQNYEKLKAQVEKHNVSKQDLLVPYQFDLVSKDAQIMAEKLKNLLDIGFEVVQEGNRFTVMSVPFVLSGMDVKKFVEEILEEGVLDKTASSLINEKLCQSACKHSIRAGDSVSKEEIFYLIERIKEAVPLCPHGRPIIVKITKKELEKMFKRTL